MFSWPRFFWWFIIELFINTVSQKTCPFWLPLSPIHQPAYVFFSALLFTSLPSDKVKCKALFLVHHRPSSSRPKTALQNPQTPFGFETLPGENQVTQATQTGGEGMWSHLIVESLYSEWWQSALWLCSVGRALPLKPYTVKPPADLGLSNVLIFTRKEPGFSSYTELLSCF